MATLTIVTTGVVICGQEKLTQDMVLYTRVMFLEYSKTSFSILEKKLYKELQTICNLGLTHLSRVIHRNRDLFEKNFATLYGITKNELSIRMEDEQIHDRIFGNWVIPLAAFITLKTVLNLHHPDAGDMHQWRAQPEWTIQEKFRGGRLLEHAPGLANHRQMCEEGTLQHPFPH